MRIGDILDGRYEVRRLWRRVFLVLDLSTGRHSVARPADGFASAEAVEVLREVVHPSLPRVLGEIEVAGCRHVLFEYLPGSDLETLVRRSGGVLTAASAATIVLAVAHTVAFLHECLDRPLVHLDIKPEHVILSGGVPCLIDFSSAVLLSRDSGAGMGDSVREATPAYAAPEMSVWRGPCVQSDIYSLGVTLFCVLGGALPVSGHLPDLRDLPENDVSGGLRAVVGRCLMADPAARFSTMSELAAALAAVSGSGGMSIASRI